MTRHLLLAGVTALLWVAVSTGPVAAQPVAVDDVIEAPVTMETGLEVPEAPVEESTADEEPAGLPAAETETVSGETAGDVPLPIAVQEAGAALAETIASNGADSPASAEALQELARAEMQAGLYDAAQSSLQRAISLLEENFGFYDARLTPALALLGEVHLSAGRPDDAVEAFRRAQHLTHRADGVYTLEQLDYLDSIARAFVAKRKYAEADRHHRFAFFVNEQNYGEDSPELVPALMKLGHWYNRVGNVRDSRRLFERAAEILETAYGPDHPSLIEPLLALGTTTRTRGQYRKQREQALQKMVQLVDADPELDAADRAAAWARLGDFYILVDDQQRAAEAYASGWKSLQDAEALPEDATAMLAQPRILHFQRRIYMMDKTPRSTFQGFESALEEFPVEMEFEATIDSNGRVRAVRVLNVDASNSTRRQLRRYVREARFRPRIEDGQPVRTENYRFKETVTIVRPEGG